jgi:hypothetical protein
MIQTTVTREQVKDLLRSCHELHAETIQDDSVPVYGLNVFADPGDRHPFTTVWWPDFVWGPIARTWATSCGAAALRAPRAGGHHVAEMLTDAP